MLGRVTASLVGVAASWTDSTICGRFIYEGPLAIERDLVAEIETEVVADFDRCTTCFTIERNGSDEGASLSAGEVWVYRRWTT